MPVIQDSFVILQPNGLYARWSGVTESFTHVNLEAGEMRSLLRNRYNVPEKRTAAWVQSARERGVKRFWDCLAIYQEYHGIIEAQAVQRAVRESPNSRTLTKAV